tara:strand:+ start:3860 stop:4030 length:171 start_codon:yes stop_codon:yes gene_type:complete
MTTFFKHVFSLLIGVGKKPAEFIVTPVKIFLLALSLGLAFLGSIALLMVLVKFLTQ